MIKKGENKNEKNKSPEKKIIEEFKGPIPKNIKKKIDPIVEKSLKANILLNLLSNNPENITEENLNSILSFQETLHEKISFLFETIISNLIQLELSRVLSLFEVFVDSIQEDSKTLIGFNILENINLHLNSNSLLNKKIHLKFVNKTNETYKTYITKNFSSPIFIVSFLIDILYRKLTDISCLSNFIFKLVFDKNIPALAKIIYGQIKILSHKNGSCKATNNYFANCNNCSPRTIGRMLKSLVKNGQYDKALKRLNTILEAKKEQLKVVKERNAIWHQIDALIG